ncbi:unnamed protein product [Ambrosiozyma monospora]|uniref:Unnamed protein product n=1 Tax=Ambrosiozyma monospora TaxID=43982 RepID=A0ACB5UCW4_AMBMO|nr:unnamed protein product [Ambrosiozyma monospora]
MEDAKIKKKVLRFLYEQYKKSAMTRNQGTVIELNEYDGGDDNASLFSSPGVSSSASSMLIDLNDTDNQFNVGSSTIIQFQNRFESTTKDTTWSTICTTCCSTIQKAKHTVD